MADKTRTERNPDGYAYRYHSQFGGTVLRFNHGEEVNGGRPFEVVPYWFSPPDTPRGDGWEALREDLNRCIESYADERVALATTRIGSGNSDLDREPLRCAEEILARAIDRLLAAAPKEPAESPAPLTIPSVPPTVFGESDDGNAVFVEWHGTEMVLLRVNADGVRVSRFAADGKRIKPAEPAQDDEAAISQWEDITRLHQARVTSGVFVSPSTLASGVSIMRRLAREKADLRAEVERLRTIITAAATQIRVAHEKEDEGAPCAASNHYEEALNMLADHAGAWSPECAKLRDFTTLGMVCKENSDLRAALIECGEIVGASVSEKCSSTFLCDVAGEVRLQVEKISAANAELRAKLAAAEQETKRLRSALRIADDIIVRGDDPSGNEPEDVCQIIESFVVVRAKLADAHEQLRCPDCGCATPEEAEAGECGCDSPVCSVEVTTTVAKELCDVAKKLAAAEERIAAIVEWTHQYGANLCPFGNYTDSFGDGMRAAKEQVSRIAELGKGGS